MSRNFLISFLLLIILGTSPLHLNARECCKDYGGYIPPPSAGRAYENACRSGCFSPCLAIGLIAIASIATVAILGCHDNGTKVVIHAHSD